MTANRGNVSDVKSILLPEDMFISFWLDKDLLVLAGDCTGVQVVEWVKVDGLLDLIWEFENQVMYQQHYSKFIAEQFRPYCGEEALNTARPIDKILTEIFSIILPPSVYSLAKGDRYRKLVIFPDSHIHLLPFHLLTSTDFGLSLRMNVAEGICYSPSASSYVYACLKRRIAEPSFGVIGIGDSTDEEMLHEAKAVSKSIPFSNEIVSNLGDLQRLSDKADLLYIITHGRSPVSSDPAKVLNENGLSRWSILFDGHTLGEADFFNNRIPVKNGAIVVLSACSIGKIMPGMVHEIEGLLNALFYAGASTVLSARWPVPSLTATAVFGGTIKNLFERKSSISAAFAKAIRDASERPDLIKLMASYQSRIFFWGPFALYGNGF